MGGASATLPAHRAVLFLMAWGGEGRGCEHIIALETSKPKSNIYIYAAEAEVVWLVGMLSNGRLIMEHYFWNRVVQFFKWPFLAIRCLRSDQNLKGKTSQAETSRVHPTWGVPLNSMAIIWWGCRVRLVPESAQLWNFARSSGGAPRHHIGGYWFRLGC